MPAYHTTNDHHMKVTVTVIHKSRVYFKHTRKQNDHKRDVLSVPQEMLMLSTTLHGIKCDRLH